MMTDYSLSPHKLRANIVAILNKLSYLGDLMKNIYSEVIKVSSIFAILNEFKVLDADDKTEYNALVILHDKVNRVIQENKEIKDNQRLIVGLLEEFKKNGIEYTKQQPKASRYNMGSVYQVEQGAS